MKKLAIVLALALACVSVFAACGKKEEPAPQPSAQEVQTPEAGSFDVGPVAGGWTVSTDIEYKIPADAQAAFDKAMEGFAGVGYTPLALLGTQVVAGTNYLYLCTGTMVTAQPVTDLYVVKVYQDLEGNAEVLGAGKIELDLIETLRANATQNPEDAPMAGGWQANAEFDDAYSKLDDMAKVAADSVAVQAPGGEKYDVVALLSTQVVAGVNYAFLQKSQATDESGAPKEFAVAFTFVDLEGNATPGSQVILSLSRLADHCNQEN